MPEQTEELKGQDCPMCKTKNLTLLESESEVPFFGKVYLFSMTCENCKYHKSDVESTEKKEPSKYTFEVGSEEDLKVRVVRSSEATIKIPHVTTITPGPAASGYITNIEGILKRVKYQIEETKEGAEDKADKKKAKNLLKKLNKVLWGQEKLKITVEDPTGNSAIISERAVKGKI
ncbi:ZPR1 zinc finger domain-containing protein [Candidatus Woesearchaeota archaeon]|nr:ZPR1 zinc finger domain-containing protein [Candidatus Woesearchaeota archaeon]